LNDIEPILKILWHYQQGLVLSDADVHELRPWLAESENHEILVSELSNQAKWISDALPEHCNEPEGSLTRIRIRLKEMNL